MTAHAALPSAARLSPRKQRQSQPLADSFFGGAAKAAAAGAAGIGQTPSATPAVDILSSSPAFATPLHPIRPFVPGVRTSSSTATATTAKHAILPILLPPATLRPLAFRTFTKKHNLTLTASALQALAVFVGRHCGSGWREEGLAERVLEETARSWKKRNCGFIVDGASPELKEILKTLEGNMSGGRINTASTTATTRPTAATTTTTMDTTAAQNARRLGGRESVADLARQDSLLRLDAAREEDITNTRLGLRPATAGPGAPGRPLLPREDSQMGTDMDNGGRGTADAIEDGDDAEDDEGPDAETLRDPRQWLKVVGGFDQPRMVYNVTKKHFERDTSKLSLLPNTTHKTAMFRNRFNVIHQRLLRNELFQSSAVAEARAVSATVSAAAAANRPLRQTHKITPVANLLGRHGSHHMLLGMLVVLPTGSLALCDLSASIALDLTTAVAIPHDSAWFTPGMIVLVDGVYEEEEDQAAGRGLNGTTGVGGTIGGRFQAFFLGQPPSETRRAALGISGPDGGPDHTIGGGFGWIDFLGVGSHRAVGARMRRLEQRFWQRQQRAARDAESERRQQQRLLPGTNTDTGAADADATAAAAVALTAGRLRVVVLGELRLDEPRTLQALRRVLALYAAEPAGTTPVAFVLAGNFTTHAVMARGGSGGGSIEYKEDFDALAAALADYPTLLQAATFVFVPGDNDGWVSAFSAGAAVPLPRRPVPDLFTSRVRRVFATANAEVGRSEKDKTVGGEAVWTTNPSRLSLFGPSHEIVLFRDDLAGRLRRAAVRLASPTEDPTEGPTEEAMDVDADTNTNTIPQDVRTARKLVKTVLDQGYLAPFRPSMRPVHWDAAGALHLYPLPTALVLVDTTAPPFCVTYEGCHVMNPGSLLVPGRRGAARWIEYAVGRTGTVRECTF